MFRDLGEGALRLIGDADGYGACLARPFENDIGVGRLTGLGDSEYQSILVIDLRLVDGVDGRRGKRNGNSGGDFDEIAAELGGVVGSSTGGEDDEAGLRRPSGPEFLDFLSSPERVRARVSGCCRISSSMRDMEVSVQHFREQHKTPLRSWLEKVRCLSRDSFSLIAKPNTQSNVYPVCGVLGRMSTKV